jgi:hypothetical protein
MSDLTPAFIAGKTLVSGLTFGHLNKPNVRMSALTPTSRRLQQELIRKLIHCLRRRRLLILLEVDANHRAKILVFVIGSQCAEHHQFVVWRFHAPILRVGASQRNALGRAGFDAPQAAPDLSGTLWRRRI